MKVGTDSMILGALIDSEGKKQGLDIGAGTGVLSLMVAQKNEAIKIDAVEIDPISSKECDVNFSNSYWEERLNLSCEDFKSFPTIKKFDLIFSNPPYYSTNNLNFDERKAQARHEISLPSDVILQKVKELISTSGDFWVIIPNSEKEKWCCNAEINGLKLRQKISIQGKRSKEANRVILCFSCRVDSVKEVAFVVRNENGSYSNEYIELTKDFHSIDLSNR